MSDNLSTTDRAWIELNMSNLENNINEFKSIIPKTTEIMAVVKANAYGHGAIPISKFLNSIGINNFAVATLQEGIDLRKSGITGNILILGYTDISEIEYVIKYNLIQTIIDFSYAQKINSLKLESKVNQLRKYENIKVVQYKKQSEFEKSLVVLPNADIIQTQNGKDNYLGNALEQEVIDFERISGKNKIRTIIAHNNEEIRNTIVDSIKKLGFADVVATATNGIETYNKIIDLKPEMVFAKFEMEDMNGFEIVKKSKEKLDSDIPVFNIFAEEMPKNEIEKIYNIAGRKFNAIISEEQYQFEVPFILEQYKKYKEYKESKEQ